MFTNLIKIIHKIFKRRFFVRTFERLSGTKIYSSIPFGVDFLHDSKQLLPNYKFETIFDVGANIGQTALHFRNVLNNSKILSFEPFLHSFNILTENTKGKHIFCYNIGLGEKKDTINALYDSSNPTSVNNSLIAPNGLSDSQLVEINTLDNFVFEENINRISFLKIDTEGFDLNVLKGAKSLLGEKRIDFIEVEVAMNPFNEKHVQLIDIKSFLEQYNYFIFGIYEQMNENSWSDNLYIRRSNIVFISKKLKQTI